MAEAGKPKRGSGFRDFQLLSFLPLFVVAAYWSGSEAVLFVVSFMFPLLLAFQALFPQGEVTLAPPRLEIGDRDGLTGLATRRQALATISRFLDAERNTGMETAVLHIDIDKFRLVNDRFGMEAGDRILAEIGQRLKSSVREADLVARIDGDDFAIVLAPIRKADYAIAIGISDRIRAAITHPDGTTLAPMRVRRSIPGVRKLAGKMKRSSERRTEGIRLSASAS